jgi:hypothetical protein
VLPVDCVGLHHSSSAYLPIRLRVNGSSATATKSLTTSRDDLHEYSKLTNRRKTDTRLSESTHTAALPGSDPRTEVPRVWLLQLRPDQVAGSPLRGSLAGSEFMSFVSYTAPRRASKGLRLVDYPLLWRLRIPHKPALPGGSQCLILEQIALRSGNDCTVCRRRTTH